MNTTTRLLGVIGWPIVHSHSPTMQAAALQAVGLDWEYGAFAVRPERLAEAVHGAAALGFVGLNVTLPHKETVLALCRPEGDAIRVGAVNTIVFGETEVRGLNTDTAGFRALLTEHGMAPKRALVLGAGGAARAVAAVLIDGGAEVVVATRSARRVELRGGPAVEHVPFDGQNVEAVAGRIDLLVDATPRGIGDADPGPLVARLASTAAVVDLVTRASTPLVEAARARGLRAVTGTAMLLHQGARAFELWTGRPAPLDVMRAALVKSVDCHLRRLCSQRGPI